VKKKGCAVVFLLYGLVMLALARELVSEPSLMADSETPSPASRVDAAPNAAPRAASEPAVAMLALSGAAVRFKTQNGEMVDGVPPRTLDVPRLVLHRNGALTDPAERTLVVEVTGIEVPPSGVTVTLAVETQHGDPDLGENLGKRISVWRESQWISNPSDSPRTGVTAVFAHEFCEVVVSDGETVATPTDYFRYEVGVVAAGHPATEPQQTFGADHAFLMESQWVVPLPEVRETSASVAPDELVVYFCDMFPFHRTNFDTSTWLPRGKVPDYISIELIPEIIQAFQIETDIWGFPWHDAWTSFRTGDDAERLSLALADGRTWFHGKAPSKGHAGMSTTVTGGNNTFYDTLTDGLMSTVYHELFHNLQRNIHLGSDGDGDVDGEGGRWGFFSEGTAVLASSVGQSATQFAQTSEEQAYMFNANRFLGVGGFPGDLNISYESIHPYRAAVYWRFLYEQCGGMANGVEDPVAGMQVIKHVLTVLYSGEVVDIASSTDLVGAVPEVMDRALAGSACPFQTYAESLVAFARAIYALGLDGGRCTAGGTPAGCGFYDPNNLYRDPPVDVITYAGTPVTYAAAKQVFPAGIKSSFGMDFVDVILDPAADGHPLTLEIYGAPGADAEFHVQLWRLVDAGEGMRRRRVPNQTAALEVLTRANGDGHLLYTMPAIDTAATNRLGLIITRVDGNEEADPIGAYSLVLRGE
jgi:hypothetical protein